MFNRGRIMQRFFVILSAALTLLISSVVTLAAETGGNAAACKPANQADVANLAFLTSGVSNNGTSSALAVCGMVRLPGSSLTTLTAEYIDNSETAQLTCVARIWHWNNKSNLWAQTKTSGIATREPTRSSGRCPRTSSATSTFSAPSPPRSAAA
jgi:hypothetical protein